MSAQRASSSRGGSGSQHWPLVGTVVSRRDGGQEGQGSSEGTALKSQRLGAPALSLVLNVILFELQTLLKPENTDTRQLTAMSVTKINALKIPVCSEHTYHWGPKGFLLGKM